VGRQIANEMVRITRVSKAEAIGSAAEGKKATVGFNGPDEPLEQLPDVFLDSYLFLTGQKLNYEFKETMGEFCDKSLLWSMPTMNMRHWVVLKGIAIGHARQ